MAKRQVEDCTSRLIRFSGLIRQQGAHKRNDRALNYEPGKTLVEDFKSHVMFVCNRHLGSKKDGQDTFEIDAFLSERLRQTMLQRWRRVSYWHHHASSLATTVSRQSESSVVPVLPVPTTMPSSPFRDMQLLDRPQLTEASHDPGPSVRSSAATTAPEILENHSMTSSKTSSVGSSGTKVRAEGLSFPAPPRVSAGVKHFECSICRLPRPTADLRRSRWQ